MDVGQFFVHGKTNLPLDEKQPTNSSECKSTYLKLVGFWGLLKALQIPFLSPPQKKKKE